MSTPRTLNSVEPKTEDSGAPVKAPSAPPEKVPDSLSHSPRAVSSERAALDLQGATIPATYSQPVSSPVSTPPGEHFAPATRVETATTSPEARYVNVETNELPRGQALAPYVPTYPAAQSPGYQTQQNPMQQNPMQGYPQPGYPPQGYPNPGYQQGYPPGYPPQNYPPGYSPHGYPLQNYPPQYAPQPLNVVIQNQVYGQQGYGPQYPLVPYVRRKDPGISTLLSFFLPGVGQLYNGQVGKGIAFLLVSFFINLPLLFVGVGFFTALGTWIWAMVDAHSSAERINRGEIVV